MSTPDPLALLQPAATRVRDPVTGRSVWLAGMVQRARVADDGIEVELVVTPEHTDADRAGMVEALERNVRGLGWEDAFRVNVVERTTPVAPEVRRRAPDPVPGMSGPGMAPHGGPIVKKNPDGVKHVIVVASGKGGVGKSTVATNLAVGLRLRGLSVGMLDADIYGPSLPIMMNVNVKPMMDDQKRLIPATAYGVRCVSMGLLVDPHEAMIWRGPMIMNMLRQFVQDVRWGELDVLVIDLPPGTGDAQLSLIQAVDLAGAVIVTTPQEVALADAVRGIQMFNKLSVPLLGLVQNMAYYLLPDGTKDFVFGEEGGRRTAERYGTDVIAELPLRTSIRRAGDTGLPTVLGSDEAAEEFKRLAATVAGRLGLPS